MELERDMLVKTVDELNTILGLVPSIDITATDVILKKIIDKVCPLIEPKDDFSDDVIKVLLTCTTLSDEVSSIFEMKIAFSENPGKLSESFSNTDGKEVTKNTNKANNVRQRKPHIIRIEELISEGRHTSSNIVKILTSEFPEVKKETVANYIRSAKSVKYTQYKHVAVEDINGVLRFDETAKEIV